MQGITTTSYLTRSLLNKIFKKDLSTDDIEDLLLQGKLVKHFSYYKATELLLRELGLIPDQVKIQDFSGLAKHSNFTLKQIGNYFEVENDVLKIISRKYFYKKHNYFYKNDKLVDILNEGEEYVQI